MNFTGKLQKAGKFWAIEVPDLAVFTQGISRANALYMIADAIETLSDDPDFHVDVIEHSNDTFSVTSSDKKKLIGFFLRQQRQMSGLTLEEVSKRLGSKSPNAYGRYEQGKAMPTLQKLDELMRALWPDRSVTIAVTENRIKTRPKKAA